MYKKPTMHPETLTLSVAVVYLLRWYSHNIHQPRLQPPYVELGFVYETEFSGGKEAIVKSRGPGFKFQLHSLMAFTKYVAEREFLSRNFFVCNINMVLRVTSEGCAKIKYDFA